MTYNRQSNKQSDDGKQADYPKIPGMKGILRSLLNFEVKGEPSIPPEQLVRNYETFTNARGFEWVRPDDQLIWDYIQKHFSNMMALPSPNVVLHYYKDDIEIEERLKDIRSAAPFTRTDFAWIVKDTIRAQRAFALKVASKIFANILEMETEVEEWDAKRNKRVKVKYKGEADAHKYMNGVLARFEESSSNEDPLPISTTTEIFAPLPPPTWLCAGLRLSPLVGSTMLAGYGFSGKSMIAQHLALCVATGSPLFGVHPVKKGRALQLDFEQGHYLTNERFQRIARGMGLDVEALKSDGSLSTSCFPKLQLDSPEAESILRRKVQGYDLVIVDSFRASCPKTEENSSEARAPLDMLSRVCGGKTLPLVIHHGKKQDEEKPSSPTQSIRGSSAFFDALGGCYHIGGTTKGIRVTHIKERLRGVCVESFLLRIVDVPSPDGLDPKWGVRIEVMAEDDIEAREDERQCATVLQVIVEHPDSTLTDLRTRCKGVGAEALGETLLHLADTGHIGIKPGPKNSKLHKALRATYERSAPSMEVEELMSMV